MTDVYSMPIQYRKLYLRKLLSVKQAEADAQEKANKGKGSSSPSMARPPKVK
jgi:hypothetical protein